MVLKALALAAMVARPQQVDTVLEDMASKAMVVVCFTSLSRWSRYSSN
jgi:hypothetical protein